MLGVRDERQKDQQRQRVHPPEDAGGGAGVGDKERGQIGDHQHEDQQRNDAGFPGELCAQPSGADEKPADEEAENAGGAGHGEGAAK